VTSSNRSQSKQMKEWIDQWIIQPSKSMVSIVDNMSEDILRFIVTRMVPVNWQFYLRDIGFMQYAGDFGAICISFGLAIFKPNLIYDLFISRWNLKTVRYSLKTGNYFLEILNLSADESVKKVETKSIETNNNVSPLFVFVHGGAWGSGRLWQYCFETTIRIRYSK